jgi:hypothetical protein
MDVLNLVSKFQVEKRLRMSRGMMPSPILVDQINQAEMHFAVRGPPEIGIPADRSIAVKFWPTGFLALHDEKRQPLVLPEVCRIKDEILKGGVLARRYFVIRRAQRGQVFSPQEHQNFGPIHRRSIPGLCRLPDIKQFGKFGFRLFNFSRHGSGPLIL